MNEYKKMIRQPLKHIIRLFAFISVLFLMISVNYSCEEADCQGCYKEAPWSAPGETTCYPEKDMCTDELGVECQKCT